MNAKFFFTDSNKAPVFGQILLRTMIDGVEWLSIVGPDLVGDFPITDLVGFSWGMYVKENTGMGLTNTAENTLSLQYSYSPRDLPNFQDMINRLLVIGDFTKIVIKPGRFRTNVSAEFVVRPCST